MTEQHISNSAEETMAFARAFATRLKRDDIVALFGDLGSGKTQFVKGICKVFHVHTQTTSPSFVILNRYAGSDESGEELLLYHLDLYRIQSLLEIYELGYEEFLQSNGICFIEWAEMLGTLLPQRRYEVHLSFGDQEFERRIDIISMREHKS